MSTFWQRLGHLFGATHEEQKPSLLNGMPRVSVPDEHEHLPDEVAPAEGGPREVAPNFHVQSPGEGARG